MPQLDITSFFSQIFYTFIILFFFYNILINKKIKLIYFSINTRIKKNNFIFLFLTDSTLFKNFIIFVKKIFLNFKLIIYYKKVLNLQN